MSEKNSVLKFDQLIKIVDSKERNQRDRGTLFEYLVKTYLKNEPIYFALYKDVWLLKDVPDKYEISKKDTGVDLVAIDRKTDELIAIQCKFYDEKSVISKENIDSFLNELGKKVYSGGIIISTTDKWSKNAEDALLQRDKDIIRIGLTQLRESRIDWASFSFTEPNKVVLQLPKEPKQHQKDALDAAVLTFKKSSRGKLIMAPGTGKTFTSLIIAQELALKKEGIFNVLYLVPSIQLLSQSIKSWTNDSTVSMESIVVCSDKKVTKNSINDLEDIHTFDIGYPATTNYEKVLKYKKLIDVNDEKPKMIVVFSTYQSIDVVSKAQKNGYSCFDLIIADEAHRTSGITENNMEVSYFQKVHDNEFIKSEKRLYQTATPKIYGERALQKAAEMSVVVSDMNDKNIFGEEIFHLGFGDAVHRNILSDYKVMILTVDESMVQRQFQQMFAAKTNELEFNDATKIIGCWNGLLKRKSNSNELFGVPMKRAIAFTGTIKQSKLITERFNEVVNHYLNNNQNKIEAFKIEIEHADGTMNALQKNSKIDWLKSTVPSKTCRILSNARFLTEGIDVPDLDAVLFLQPRRSTIDIAQAVGRVMRKSVGKEYGYVILPIGIPSGLDENKVLDSNEKFSVVWEVLNALRSIDERFDAMINKIELNKKKPSQIDVIGVGSPPDLDNDEYKVDRKNEQLMLEFSEDQFSNLAKAIYGKIVTKVGNTRYWESWSKDVYELAQQYITRITSLVKHDVSSNQLFEEFTRSLRNNINPTITVDQAIEMIAQHAITKPVFDSLFEKESFALNNPVSQAMNNMIQMLEEMGFKKEQEKLEGFYDSVKIRAQGLDNLEAKQKIIIQLYEKFFKIGFPKTTESLGIVFTPIEVVDFINSSINFSLKEYFNKSLSDKNVNLLDPFTGTGTFIARLFQTGLINKEDMLRKYKSEIFANEIVLLSYYIATINIEESFKEVMMLDKYIPFEGIVLTDTFETTERDGSFDDELFHGNNLRLIKQKEAPITIIFGNPPYSGGATNDNDNNSNQDYPRLDKLIENSFSKYSTAKMKKGLYDSYIRAFKWSSERIGKQGIIAFVTNGSFIDGQATDGLRKCWFEEFNHIYIFNARGDAYTQGEQRQKEKGNIFGSGSRTTIAITILIKDLSENHDIYYYDIGDYLDTNEKLTTLNELKSIENIKWSRIYPNSFNDWINKRSELYREFYSVIDETPSVFKVKYTGVNTSRDNWVYGFSKESVKQNVERMINNYNFEVERLNYMNENDKMSNLNLSPSFVNWSRSLRQKLVNNKSIEIDKKKDYLVLSQYRPFVKKWLYYQKDIVEMPGKFLSNNLKTGEFNLLQTTGKGAKNGFSALMTSFIPNFDLMTKGQGYILEDFSDQLGLDLDISSSNFNLEFLIKLNLSGNDAMYYIYALMHSKEYINKFRENLIKETPRIPILSNAKDFVEIGKKMAYIHMNYENIKPYSKLNIIFNSDNPKFKVEKMKFTDNKLSIIFNKDIKISNIPSKAYKYVVNGKSAIDWIVEYYQIKVDDESNIIDDPNLFSVDSKYIFNLLLSVINVSIQTVDLIESLPSIDFEN